MVLEHLFQNWPETWRTQVASLSKCKKNSPTFWKGRPTVFFLNFDALHDKFIKFQYAKILTGPQWLPIKLSNLRFSVLWPPTKLLKITLGSSARWPPLIVLEFRWKWIFIFDRSVLKQGLWQGRRGTQNFQLSLKGGGPIIKLEQAIFSYISYIRNLKGGGPKKALVRRSASSLRHDFFVRSYLWIRRVKAIHSTISSCLF